METIRLVFIQIELFNPVSVLGGGAEDPQLVRDSHTPMCFCLGICQRKSENPRCVVSHRHSRHHHRLHFEQERHEKLQSNVFKADTWHLGRDGNHRGGPL